jgi:polyhydroxyalkanoate synthesis regulator phasin
MMLEAMRGYLQLAGGVTEMTRQRARGAAKAMLSTSGATREQVQALADELVATSKGNRDALVTLIRFEVDRGLGRLGLAQAEDVAALERRVAAVEAAVRERSGDAVDAKPAGRKKAAAPRSPARDTAARVTAEEADRGTRPAKAAKGSAATKRAAGKQTAGDDAQTGGDGLR